ncbi:MAG TPA: hypothetical protein VJA66_16660 [Thermoanaerobaculia bacterium]
MTSLFAPLALTAAVLVAATALGWLSARLVLPGGRLVGAEVLAWSFAMGCALVAAAAAASFALSLRSVGAVAGFLGLLVAGIARRWRPKSQPGETPPGAAALSIESGSVWLDRVLGLAILLAVALYTLRALTEPMWSNDFLAIWGLKGRGLFFARGIPATLRLPQYGFSHPEYPLGLPLLYAGLASIVGTWDDQALALLFPCVQGATALALYGWLRRRGAERTLALAAAALLSLLAPLYSAFATGMAEVPFAFAGLLFATALSDALDRTDAGATNRLCLASFLCAAVKNEGLFLAVAGAVIAVVSGSPRRRRAAAGAILPAAGVAAAQRLVVGNVPLRDFDFSLLSVRIAELPGRVAADLGAALSVAAPSWLALLALAALFAAGRRTAHGDRILALAAASFTAYLVLPVLAVLGPAWLISTSFARTSTALAPMVAAGITARLSGAASAAAEDPRESEGRAERPIPSTPAS